MFFFCYFVVNKKEGNEGSIKFIEIACFVLLLLFVGIWDSDEGLLSLFVITLMVFLALSFLTNCLLAWLLFAGSLLAVAFLATLLGGVYLTVLMAVLRGFVCFQTLFFGVCL